MSKGQCFKVSNNKYFNSPALMADGRTFTDYTQNVISNIYLMKKNKLQSNNDYRQFLIHNADKIMNHNISMNEDRNSTGKCDAIQIGRNTLGYKYKNDLKINRSDTYHQRPINLSDKILLKKKYTKHESIREQSAKPGIMCNSCRNPVPGRTYRGSLD
jgi:hypothetical protein